MSKAMSRFPTRKILDYLARPMELKLSQTDAPQVLVVHTHATEAFNDWDYTYYDKRNSWRSTDNSKNMVAVGEELSRVLSENGIGVIHDKTQHDYPSYNGSYERSAETIKAYLSRYPTIKVVLDLHRDAIEREGGVIVKPTTVIDGQKAAQLMIIACCDNGQMNMPRWDQNFRFAAALADAVEDRYPTLTRPIFFLPPQIQPGPDHRIAAVGIRLPRLHPQGGRLHRKSRRAGIGGAAQGHNIFIVPQFKGVSVCFRPHSACAPFFCPLC
jgi:stage II sporulation protein P